MAHGTVNIQFTERLDKDVARVYGMLTASIGSTSFKAERFGLKSIRTVQLTPLTVQRSSTPTPSTATVDYPYCVASIDTQGSVGNLFRISGTPGKIQYGTPISVGKTSRIHFKVVGE